MHDVFSENDDRVNSILSTINKMIGQQDMLIQRKSEIITEISNANEYLEHQDEVSQILNDLQDRAQAKTKTIYEELLTTLIHEVKGYDKENHKVVLNTKIKNNRPWLDVEVENDEGIPRDVFLDKGGSIKSIVAMGLRFITLSRTKNRRVIFFDEPDKEINAKYADGIAKILYQLTKKIGMQVVYISHHDSSYFEGYARIIELSRIGHSIVTDTVSDINEKKYEEVDDEISSELEGIGIRYIRLKNLKQHHNTMIELSPFVTVITGDNDIGKSSVMHAMDAVNKNKGRDGLIRDNESYCMVEIGLEDNTSLSWTYKRSGNKRTSYSLKDSENIEVQSSDSGTAAPEWLSMYLGMAMYKDFDLNMSDQNNTSFILDGKVSGHKRAEILSLGKETNQALSMIKEHNQRCENFSKKKFHLKKELNAVKNRLECFRHLYSVEEKIQAIKLSQKNAQKIHIELNEISTETKKIIHLANYFNALRNVPSVVIKQMDNSEYANDKITISNIEYLTKKINILNKVDKVFVQHSPNVEDLSPIVRVGSELRYLRRKLEIFNMIGNKQKIEVPDLFQHHIDKEEINKYLELKAKNDVLLKTPSQTIKNIEIIKNDEIAPIAKLLKSLESNFGAISEEESLARKELKQIIEEKENLLTDFKGECPICGSHIANTEVYHDHK